MTNAPVALDLELLLDEVKDLLGKYLVLLHPQFSNGHHLNLCTGDPWRTKRHLLVW